MTATVVLGLIVTVAGRPAVAQGDGPLALDAWADNRSGDWIIDGQQEAVASTCTLDQTIRIPIFPPAPTGVRVDVYDALGALVGTQEVSGYISAVTVTMQGCQYDWYWIGLWDHHAGSWAYDVWVGFVDASMGCSPTVQTPVVQAQQYWGTLSTVTQSLTLSGFSPAVAGSAWLGVWDVNSSSWIYGADKSAPVTSVSTDPYSLSSGSWYWAGTWDYTAGDWNSGFWIGYFE